MYIVCCMYCNISNIPVSLNANPRSWAAHAGEVGSWVEMAFTRVLHRGGCFSMHFYQVCRDHLTERSWTLKEQVRVWSTLVHRVHSHRHTSHPVVWFVYLYWPLPFTACPLSSRWRLVVLLSSGWCTVPDPFRSCTTWVALRFSPKGPILALIQPGCAHLHVSALYLYYLSFEKVWEWNST